MRRTANSRKSTRGDTTAHPRPRALALGAVACAVWRLLSGDGTWAADRDVVLLHEDFEQEISERWVERGFPSIERKNRFLRAADADHNHYLRVESAQSSSGFGLHLRFDPVRCPELTWRWTVSNTIPTADLRSKEGDDAPAKLYVIFDGPSAWNPLDKRILVFVWDDVTPVGTVLPNAWLPDGERMLVVESGRGNVGRWVSERAHLAKDFVRAFPGEEPGAVEALAFMADTDNTATEVSAGLDDVEIRCVDAASDPRP